MLASSSCTWEAPVETTRIAANRARKIDAAAADDEDVDADIESTFSAVFPTLSIGGREDEEEEEYEEGMSNTG